MKSFEEKLVEILKSFSIKEIIWIEKNLDKQYLALKELFERIKDAELFIKLVVTNALLSYQLNTKGEIYWQNFAKFFSEKSDYNYFEDFLKNYNPRFLSVKLKRFKKIREFLNSLTLKDFDFFINNPQIYLNKVAEVLNQKIYSKTVVFSLKMLFYSYRIIKKTDIAFPFEIMIPIDFRIGKISENLSFWKKVERETQIPLLHLDSVLWITYGLTNEEIERIENKEIKKKIIKVKELLQKVS